MPAKEYNEVKMRGILPSEGMDNIPVTESAPLSSIEIEPKAGMGNLPVTESAPLTSIQVEPKPNATPIPVGKIPDGGTQITKSVVANGATELLHQVTNGTTLFLCLGLLSITNLHTARDFGQMLVTDSGDNLLYYFLSVGVIAGDGKMCAFPFITPLEILSTYKIQIISGDAADTVVGYIHGYEVID